MSIPAINFPTTGGEWSIGSVGSIGSIGLEDGSGSGVDGVGGIGGVEGAERGGGGGFGSMLADQLTNLENLQSDAAEQSRALATGQATDPGEVVVAVERARLAMQLAAQLRTKGVEAIQDVMRTSV